MDRHGVTDWWILSLHKLGWPHHECREYESRWQQQLLIDVAVESGSMVDKTLSWDQFPNFPARALCGVRIYGFILDHSILLSQRPVTDRSLMVEAYDALLRRASPHPLCDAIDVNIAYEGDVCVS